MAFVVQEMMVRLGTATHRGHSELIFDEKPDAVRRPRGCIRDHSRPVVLAEHDQDSRPGQQPDQAKPSFRRAALLNAPAIPGPQQVLSGDGAREHLGRRGEPVGNSETPPLMRNARC